MTMNTTNKQINSCTTGTCVSESAIKRPQSYRAPVDVYETEDRYLVVADMPGVSLDGIEISVEDKMLTIDATVEDRYLDLGRVRHQEYGIADFHRSFRIGSGISAEDIVADYSDGVLQVTLPKVVPAKARRIEVRTA